MPEFTPEDVLEKLRQFVKKSGNQTEAAKQLGISKPYISQILSKTRPIPDSVATRLGFTQKKTVYEGE